MPPIEKIATFRRSRSVVGERVDDACESSVQGVIRTPLSEQSNRARTWASPARILRLRCLATSGSQRGETLRRSLLGSCPRSAKGLVAWRVRPAPLARPRLQGASPLNYFPATFAEVPF